jgi:hypothetical protein
VADRPLGLVFASAPDFAPEAIDCTFAAATFRTNGMLLGVEVRSQAAGRDLDRVAPVLRCRLGHIILTHLVFSIVVVRFPVWAFLGQRLDAANPLIDPAFAHLLSQFPVFTPGHRKSEH